MIQIGNKAWQKRSKTRTRLIGSEVTGTRLIENDGKQGGQFNTRQADNQTLFDTKQFESKAGRNKNNEKNLIHPYKEKNKGLEKQSQTQILNRDKSKLAL